MEYFYSSLWKIWNRFFCFFNNENINAYCCRFLVKLICCMLLDQHQVLDVYLNLLLSSFNIFKNNYSLANNQLYNHVLDLLQFFEYYRVIKWVFTGRSNKFCLSIITLSEDNIVCNLLFVLHFQMIKKKPIYPLKCWIN